MSRILNKTRIGVDRLICVGFDMEPGIKHVPTGYAEEGRIYRKVGSGINFHIEGYKYETLDDAISICLAMIVRNNHYADELVQLKDELENEMIDVVMGIAGIEL